MEKIIFTHAHLIIDGNKEYLDGALLVNGDTIEDVFVNYNEIKKDVSDYKEINVNGNIVMPGFFDTHMHGSSGVDFNKANKEEINNASIELAKNGTTSFLTSLTGCENLSNELKVLNGIETQGARYLGVHLEGPFISKKAKGALREEYLLSPTLEKLNNMLSLNDSLRQMTLAPEIKGSKEVSEKLKELGIKTMLGHSKSLIKDFEVDNYDGFTHLFNAMSPFSHRDLGLVNLAFNNTDKYSELICDGKHIDESVLKIAFKNLRRDRIIVISDSTMMSGQEDGKFTFEGQTCEKKGITCYVENKETIAGSAAYMIDEVKLLKKIGLSLTDILLCTSLNAYRFYGLDQRFGSLTKGKYADIVILDDDMNLVNTYVRGKLYA